MPADEKVSRGQRFRPNAALHNTLVDVAAEYRSSRMSGGLAGETDLSAIPQTIIRVRNDTGAMVGRGRILGLDEPLRDPDDGETPLRNDLVMKGVAPTSDHVHGKWCVTLEAIANGQIGEAIVAGVALVRLSLLNADHTHAECATSGGETTRYAVSAEHGSARILWTGGTPDEDDLQLALLRLGDYQPYRAWYVAYPYYTDAVSGTHTLRIAENYCMHGDAWQVTDIWTLTCQRKGMYRISIQVTAVLDDAFETANEYRELNIGLHVNGGISPIRTAHDHIHSRWGHDASYGGPAPQTITLVDARWFDVGDYWRAVVNTGYDTTITWQENGTCVIVEWIGDEECTSDTGPITTTTTTTTTTAGPTTTTTQPCPGYGTCAEITPNTWLAKCVGGAWVVLCDTCDPGLVADTSGCTAPCTEGACCAGSCGPGPTTTTTSPPPTTTTAGPTTTTTPAGCVSSEVCGYEWDGMQWIPVSSCIAGVCCQGACECCPPETAGMYYGQFATGTCGPIGTCGGGPPATTTMMPPPPP